MARVLIASSRIGLRDRLAADGHQIHQVESIASFPTLPAQLEIDALISMVPADAAEEALLRGRLQGLPPPVLIVLVATETFELARSALRLGAVDVLSSDGDGDGDLLAEAVTRALRNRQPAAEGVETQTVFAGVEPDALPRAIVDAACRVLRADDASLMLLGADNRLHLAYSCGLSKRVQEETSVALGERVAGRIALSGKPTILGGAVEGSFKGERDLRSSIVFPLQQGARLIGVLNLNRKDGSVAFADPDLTRTSTFATQVVMALENVRLLRQVAAGEGMAAVGRIAAAVAHEINNPAGWVLASLSYLREELQKPRTSREELRSALEDATSGMLRIRDIVRDFQMLTQGESHQTCFDLSEAIRSASRVAGAVIHGAAVTLDLQAELPVVGSRSSLSQAFVNLILNAGAEESPGRRIVIKSHREGDFAIATVADSGRGIAAGQLATLFDPVFGSRGPRFAGLGLSISRDIVRQHGGEVLVHSSDAEGTVLTVRLPSADVALKQQAPLHV